MKNNMQRFKINDKVKLLKLNKAIRLGTITKGPYAIQGIDHYTVQWEYDTEDGDLFKLHGVDDIICDLPSAKYRYQLA